MPVAPHARANSTVGPGESASASTCADHHRLGARRQGDGRREQQHERLPVDGAHAARRRPGVECRAGARKLTIDCR